MNHDLDQTWDRVQRELRRAVTDGPFHIWLQPLRLEDRIGDVLLVSAPDEIRSWVSDRFSRVLQTCAAAALGPQVTVDIVAPGSAPGQSPQRARGNGHTASAPDLPERTLNPKYTFGQYVIGDGNRLAHAAALAVAEQPGHAYNPLFIYGPPGLGKTHLLHSIGNYITEHERGLTVRCVTTEAFTDGFIRSLHSGSIEKFKERYRNADVLLVDDVQFFESKAKTEAEFFHTFNALYETGAQLVLTSDRMPRDLEALEARLRERFESGLVTDVERPDYATRLTILRMRAKQAGVEFDDRRGLDVIAARIDSNVRALEGALIRVVAFHSMHANRPLDGDLAREVLDTLYPPGRAAHTARTSVRAIQDATAARFAISRDELLSASRAARLALPRQVAMYLARELTDEPLATIGRAFGDRTHSTVLHACQATAARMTRDPETFDAVRELTDTLRGASADRVP